jgi:hypothetical protein
MAVVLGVASLADAQEPPSPPQPSAKPVLTNPAPIATPADAIDPEKLGVDLAKVQAGLAQGTTEERLSANGLRLDYRIQVFGKAPVPDLFKNFDLVNGPVPFGAPTHKDFLNMVTPEEFRAPAANFSALAFWALRKLSDSNERKRCEDELTQYREQLMQGIAAAAPSCAR